MRPLLVFLSLVACSPGVAGSSTTSLQPGPSSPTTFADTSPITSAPTTSTVANTTTSAAVSTTTSLLAGNWADEPLVTTPLSALGWWEGSFWVQVDDSIDLPVSGGEDYQVATLGPVARTTGGPATKVCDPLDNPGVELADPGLLGAYPGPFGVAISAPWELMPHLVEEIDDAGPYVGFASSLLQARGLDVPAPVIKQLLRVDLEGDGVNEVIVVAEDATLGFSQEPGDYSIVFLRKVVQGAVETSVLGESVSTGDEGALQLAFAIGAVADLNGDGQMEVVVNSGYYEGLAIEIWEYLDDDIGMVKALEGGCGV